MKRIVILLHFIGFIAFSHAQVGINTTSPSARAALDVNSQINATTYGGFLPPRITVAQRDAMPVTALDDGMIAYVSGFSNGDRCLQLFNGLTLTWESIQCFSAPSAIPGVAFIETFGTPSGNPVVSLYEAANGFDNDASTFSSSSSPEVDVRTTTPSTTTGASASGNIFFASGTRNLTVQGINVSAYTGPLTLQVLIYKGVLASDGSELTIEYSSNGTLWTAVTLSGANLLPTGTGTTGWYEKILSATVPNTIQYIRFSKTAAVDFRIDDIKILY